MLRNEHARILDCRSDNDIAAVRTRNRAADQYDFFGFAHLHDLKILHGDAFVTHVTRHSHVFPNTAGSRTIADRANAPVRFRSMCRTLSVEVVPLHHALTSFS